MTKQELIENVYNNLSKKDEYEQIFCDVPFEGGSIDMVLVDKERRLTTIGFGLENWKKTLRSARTHALAADWTFICLPGPKWPLELKHSASQQGIGVLLFNPGTGKVSALTRPLSGPPWREFREQILQHITP